MARERSFPIRVGKGDFFQGLENEGVMGEEELASGGDGRLDCVRAGIERHHDLACRRGGVPDLKPDVVPLFGTLKWS